MSTKPGPDVCAVIYDTDGNSAEVVNGRVLVNAQVAAVGKGAINEYLEYSSSKEMAIDADGSPQQFVWNPGSEDITGQALSFIIEDATIYFGDKFGGIDDLTNGVLIELKSEDVSYTLANIQRTREFLQLSTVGGFEVYSATPDCMRVEVRLTDFIFKATGTYGTDDYVRVTIRDDLTGLSHMSALFKGTKE